MYRSVVCVGLIAFLTASPAFPAAINVGTHYLLPNTPGQRIALYVVGTEDAAGMDFNVQVANGGPELEGVVARGRVIVEPGEGIDGPEITGIDLVSGLPGGPATVFGAVDHRVISPYSIVPQAWVGGIVVEQPFGTVVANGLLGTVTFDTTEFSHGSWDLFLGNPHNDTTTLLDNSVPAPHPIPLQITEGSIQIASGTSRVVDGGFAAGLLDDWTVAGGGTAEVIEFPPDSGNHVAELTAGSEVLLGQTVDTPDVGFLAGFDYAFQSAGTLEVLLGSQPIGRFEAAEPGELRLARLQIDDPALMGLDDVELAFRFNGQTGSRVLLDNISVRGVPEPTTLLMLLGLAGGVPLVVARRKRGGYAG